MAWYTAVFLGLVQGLAEFLPISSSGHLLLFGYLFGLTDGGLLFTIILHLATLLAVVVVYRRRLWALLKRPCQREVGLLLLATGLTCGCVLCFKDWLDRMFTIQALPYAFLVAGLFLLLPWLIKPKTNQHVWWQSAAMGLAQGIAVVPGFTRSGLTITAGQLAGMRKTDAADFSFLMSIPIILASLLYELLRGGSLSAFGWGNLLLAFVTAFVSGIIAIKVMLGLIRKIDLRWFAAYLLALGAFLALQIGF